MTDDERLWLHEEFERCREWIEAALEYDYGTHNVDDVRELVLAGKAQLWPAANSVVIATVDLYPRKKVLRAWLAGGKLSEIRKLDVKISDWGRQNGCDVLVATGRRGWARAVDGFREQSTVSIKELR